MCQFPNKGKNQSVNNGDGVFTSIGGKTQQNSGGQDEKKQSGIQKHDNTHYIYYI